MIECERKLSHDCYLCHTLNWTVNIEPDETIEMCFERYWTDKAPEHYEDCNDIKQFCNEVLEIPLE